MSRGVTMSGPGRAAGVIFGDDFVDRSRKVDQEILFDVAGASGELRVEGTCEKGNMVNEGEKAGANATERFDNTRDHGLALGCGVASEFVLFT